MQMNGCLGGGPASTEKSNVLVQEGKGSSLPISLSAFLI